MPVFLGIFGVSLLVHITTLCLGLTIYKDWRMVHEPLHTAVEVGGSFVAFFVAYFLIGLEGKEFNISGNRLIAAALIGMGVLDGFHAIAPIGQSFVWLHSIATFVGGALFLTVWIPEYYSNSIFLRKWPLIVTLLTLALGFVSYYYAHIFPPMLKDGLFTSTAKLLNIIGGVFFFLASLKLIMDYRQTKNIDGLLFFLHCIFFGGAAIMFDQSQLWDMPWWGWHVLRFMAYMAALYFVIKSFNTEQRVNLQRYRDQLNTAALVSETDVWGIITYVNDKFCEVSKFSREELIGKNHNVVNSGYHSEEFWRDLWLRLRSGKSWAGEICNMAKDGSLYWLQATLFPVLDHNSKIIAYTSIRVDISRQKETEGKLQHQAKLASIGEMAAGVGHEINNPLALGTGNLLRIKKILTKDKLNIPTVMKAIENVEVANERIRKIVDGLRTYARVDLDNNERVLMSSAIDQSVNLISEIYQQEGIKITKKYPNEDLYIRGSNGKVQQIMMSFISNAKHAVKGRIDSEICICVSKRNDKQLTLSVKDNGIGISEKIKDKILEPFFTTKKAGVGTGMGLGLVNVLIREMNGELIIESEEDVGSTFSVIFPLESMDGKKDFADSNSTCTEQQRSDPPPQVFALTGKALVVDDEEGIRELLVEHLEDLGLQVDEADDGITALEKVRSYKYDFICTDMKMVHMSGDEFIREALKLPNGNTKYLVITGGVSGDKMKSVENLIHGYISKPFTEELIFEALSN